MKTIENKFYVINDDVQAPKIDNMFWVQAYDEVEVDQNLDTVKILSNEPIFLITSHYQDLGKIAKNYEICLDDPQAYDLTFPIDKMIGEYRIRGFRKLNSPNNWQQVIVQITKEQAAYIISKKNLSSPPDERNSYAFKLGCKSQNMSNNMSTKEKDKIILLKLFNKQFKGIVFNRDKLTISFKEKDLENIAKRLTQINIFFCIISDSQILLGRQETARFVNQK